jgi:hypothetical protein
MIGIDRSETVWACVLPAPIPSIARSKNLRKTRTPSLFFLDRQTLRGKVSGRPDRKKLQRKTVYGPVSLTAFLGYGARKCQATGQKRLMRTALFFQLWADPSPVPPDRGQNANLTMLSFDGVIMDSQMVIARLRIARHIPPASTVNSTPRRLKQQSGCDPRLWHRSSSSNEPKPTGSDILGLLACATVLRKNV